MTRTVAQSTPYSWPWDGELGLDTTAVLVIAPRGGPFHPDGPERRQAVRVIETATTAGGRVIHVMTRPPGRTGDQGLVTLDGDHVHASGIDGFYGSRLDALLRKLGITQLILVGSGLETCVHSTMRSANDRGYECLLVIDACEPYESSLVASARSQIEMSGGIFGAVGTTDHVCAALVSTPSLHHDRTTS